MAGKSVLDIAAFEQELMKIKGRFPDFPWENREAYGEWLAQTYFLVLHTTRFVALAAGRSAIEDRDQHYAMVHHLKEESHHDLVALRDLKTLGYKIEDFTEHLETRLIRNNQYYWLEYGHPLALNGYALMLEGLSIKMGPSIIEKLNDSPNRDATAFWKLHVEVDQDHYADGLAGLQGIPQNIMQEIFANLEETSYLYLRMMENCKAKAKGQNNAKSEVGVRADRVAKKAA